MVQITKETFPKNCIHAITQVRKSKKLVFWIRIKDIGKRLNVKNIFDLVHKEIKGKFETNYATEQQIRKYKIHGSKFIENEKFMCVRECIIILVIMHCRGSTPKSIELRSKLGFNQYDITLTKEQLELKSRMDAFEEENMQTQYSILGYRTDLYFHDYKLAIEVDEKGHKDRIIDHEIQRQKALEKELSYEFIRINSDEKDFNIFRVINEIHRHIKNSTEKLTEKSTKKSLIDELSNKLLRLEFKSNNSIKAECLKYVVKKYCLHYEHENLLLDL